MTGSVLAIGSGLWLAAVIGLACSARPREAASTRLAVGAGPAAPGAVGIRHIVQGRWHRSTERLGGAIRRIGRRPADADLDRRAGSAGFALAMAAPVDLRLALIVGLLTWMRPIRAQRRLVQHRHHRVLQELPEVVDLLSVAVRGGLTVPLAVAAVGDRLDGEVATALQQCVEEASLGQRLSDRLETLPAQLGDATRPLVRALIAADRYGVPIGDPLERVAADVRTARRRNAEIAARRVPIKLLFPLVFCVLPSFALLTVAPVLASSLESLRL